jgi:hypothetical protein
VHGERDNRLGKRQHRRLGKDVFARFQDFTRKPAQKKAERFESRVFVWKGNDDHGRDSLNNVDGLFYRNDLVIRNGTSRAERRSRSNILPVAMTVIAVTSSRPASLTPAEIAARSGPPSSSGPIRTTRS